MSESDNKPASLEDYSPDQLASMGRLYAQLVQNPATRLNTLRSTKTISPNTPIPELDVLDQVAKGMKPYIDETAALKKNILERDVRDGIEAKRRELYSKGHTKEQVEQIEKLMVERKIPDHDTAAEFFKLQSKAAEPTTPKYQYQPNTLPLDKEKAKAAGGFKKFYQNDAHAAIDDIRAGRVKLNS